MASELEDYMDELEDIKISFDEGETELNFAEGERPCSVATGAGAFFPSSRAHIACRADRLPVLCGCLCSRDADSGLYVRVQPQG